jgi:hypothetical protein
MIHLQEVGTDIVIFVFCLLIGAGIGHLDDKRCKAREADHAAQAVAPRK